MTSQWSPPSGGRRGADHVDRAAAGDPRRQSPHRGDPRTAVGGGDDRQFGAHY
ncbi:hypothetical protein Pd630_LPD02286 [Rhodococcus opacus PD630]|nr:hypothetical protein Pd630_LPD02286 [Rhodococcus opacus PD630]